VIAGRRGSGVGSSRLPPAGVPGDPGDTAFMRLSSELWTER
jgi:hypothetical protein